MASPAPRAARRPVRSRRAAASVTLALGKCMDEDGLGGLEHRAGGPEHGDPSPAMIGAGGVASRSCRRSLRQGTRCALIDAAKRRPAAASGLASPAPLAALHETKHSWHVTRSRTSTRDRPGTVAAAARGGARTTRSQSAADAFGERAGIEQSGLYTESQVRGFDLNDSGAYRIDDAYFSRAAALDDTVLAGVGVRVGVNAARLAYPAPSGVVNYRLREAGPANELRLGAGFRDFGTRVVQGDGSFRERRFQPRRRLRLASRCGASRGGNAAGPSTSAPSSAGRSRPVSGCACSDRSTSANMTATMRSSPARRPCRRASRRCTNIRRTGPRRRPLTTNLGVLYRASRAVSPSISRPSARSSTFDADNTLISSDADGNATATTSAPRPRQAVSDSARDPRGPAFEAGDLNHLATVSLRGRRTTVELASSLAIPLGAFDLRAAIRRTCRNAPGPARAARTPSSRTPPRRAMAWPGATGSQLRFAVHRTRYDKAVLSTAGVRTEGVSETTLYNASAVVNLTDRAAVFGSWVTGLEETGSRPPPRSTARKCCRRWKPSSSSWACATPLRRG